MTAMKISPKISLQWSMSKRIPALYFWPFWSQNKTFFKLPDSRSGSLHSRLSARHEFLILLAAFDNNSKMICNFCQIICIGSWSPLYSVFHKTSYRQKNLKISELNKGIKEMAFASANSYVVIHNSNHFWH